MKYTIFRLPFCRGSKEAWLLSDGGKNIPDGVGEWQPIKSGHVWLDKTLVHGRSIEDYMLEVSGLSMTGCKLNGVGVLGLLPGDIVVMTAEEKESSLLNGAWIELSIGRLLLSGLFYEEAVAGMEKGRWRL